MHFGMKLIAPALAAASLGGCCAGALAAPVMIGFEGQVAANGIISPATPYTESGFTFINTGPIPGRRRDRRRSQYGWLQHRRQRLCLCFVRPTAASPAR